MEKRRARNPEEKALRKQSIVLSLRELLLKSRDPLPTINDIAAAAGVSKGVVYFYFQSREEVFLTLHMQESVRFFEGINKLLLSKRYSLAKAREFVVTYFVKNDLFMYLGLVAPTILETNVTPEFALAFKREMAAELDGFARNWMAVESVLDLSSARNFILRFYFLALMEWQRFHPPESIRVAFPSRDLWLIAGDLKEELARSFDWLWNGMVAERTS